MSLANTPVVHVCYDDANRAKILVTAWYTGGANTSNTKIQANTLFGANASLPCILDVLSIEGSVSTNSPATLIHVQFESNVNTNTDILIAGGSNMVHLDGYIPNNANTPSGDINIFLNGGTGVEGYSLMLTLAKNNQGVTSNGIPNYGAGAWSNGFINT